MAGRIPPGRVVAGSGGSGSAGPRAARITTVASRSFVDPRGGDSLIRSGGSGGAGAYNFRVGSNGAGGGGYGIWRHAGFQPQRSPFVANSFCDSVNYAYRPSVWGFNPWWGSRYNHSWHHGCWDYGWNDLWATRYAYYARPVHSFHPPGYGIRYSAPTSFVPWGLSCWTLGRLAYDTGYYTYYNPYVAPPVTTSTTIIRYAEPITVVAANHEPGTEEAVETAAEKSAAAMDRARTAFRADDPIAALKSVDEAISHSPGDQVLHEFRALNLFALGKYSEATGVLHSVLASGPGWDWETMIGFYENPDRYTEQFRKLEDHVAAHPDDAGPHFLLGYHYLVGKNLAEAYTMLDRVATLQPEDTVSLQLKSLLADSAPESSSGNATPPEPAEPDKTPIEAANLHGIWKAPSAENKTITLSLTAIGTFSWNYEGSAGEVLSGEWSLDEDGLLVLKDDDVQMVGDIKLNENGTLHFLLAGSPEGDPGLTFKKE